jgi:hypothetical protein
MMEFVGYPVYRTPAALGGGAACADSQNKMVTHSSRLAQGFAARAGASAIIFVAALSCLVVQTGATNGFAAEQAQSTEESALNPFGDPWSLAKPNPSAALMGTAGCYRKPAPDMTFAFTQQELDYHKALATPFVLENCAVIYETDPPIRPRYPGGGTEALKARVAQFKQENPAQKYIGYYDFARWEATPIGQREILRSHPEWFVYRRGASKDDLSNRLYSRKRYTLDVTNPEYQDFVAEKIAGGLTYYGMDGLLVDGVGRTPLVAKGEEDLVPDDVRANWADGEIATLEKIKRQIGTEKFLVANVSRGEADAFKARVLAVADGVMVEDGFSPIARPLDPSEGRLAGTLQLYDLAAKAGKYVIVTANTFVDGSTYDDTSSDKEHAYARYYLAAHLIFMKGKVMMLYNPPSAVQRQYGAEAFFRDWNINVGAPAGSYSEVAQGVFQRDFANAIVYLNSSDAPYTIDAPEGFSLSPEGETMSEFTLEPKSGFLLSSPQALQ